MVYYFTSNVTGDPAFIYVGKDKVENEDLIKYGWDEDVCAHVYLRMQPGWKWDELPQDLLADCAQLTKANSIEGNKKDNVTIIYTPWSNLQKNNSMATGQVGFHNPRLTKKILIPTRLNPTINRLNKTRTEITSPDLYSQREENLRKKNREERKKVEERRQKEKEEKREREAKKWQKDHAYDDMFGEDQVAGSSNQDREEGWEDDFM